MPCTMTTTVFNFYELSDKATENTLRALRREPAFETKEG
jgi:hypothetical protein